MPSMNCACVQTDAMVVNSLMTTCAGGLLPNNRQQRDRRIVAALTSWFATCGHQIETGVSLRTRGANFKAALVVGLSLRELLGCACTGCPQRHG